MQQPQSQRMRHAGTLAPFTRSAPRKWNGDCAQMAATLDPLGLDALFVRLPTINRGDDAVLDLVGVVECALPGASEIVSMNLPELLATGRDLGILLCSIRRRVSEPIALVPRFASILRALGAATDMIPRDTVYHYGPCNPVGDRERTFTGDPQEAALIESVRSSAPNLEACVEAMLVLIETSPRSEAFAKICKAAVVRLYAMVEAIQLARTHVDVQFFAQVLRPYFEPVAIDAETFLGPAAAHLPLYLVDQLLWSSDAGDVRIQHFHEETATYGIPRWREVFNGQGGKPSLTTLLADEVERFPTDLTLRRSASSLWELYRVLLRFRGAHRVLAAKAYDPSIRMFPVGSGGYETTDLNHLLQVTVANAERMRRCLPDPEKS